MPGQQSPLRNGRCGGCGTPSGHRPGMHEELCAGPRARGLPWFGAMRRPVGNHRGNGNGRSVCIVCRLAWWITRTKADGNAPKFALDRHLSCFNTFRTHPGFAVARRIA